MVVSAVSVAAEEGDLEVSEDGLVAVAAAALEALADKEKWVDMAEMGISETALTELAMEVGSVD